MYHKHRWSQEDAGEHRVVGNQGGCSDGKKRRERITKRRSDMERNNMKGRM